VEIVLLWLDELDDLLFSVALVWERLRRALLQVGLAAAFGLAVTEVAVVATQWAPLFCGVAALSVSAWLAGAAAHVYYDRERRSSLTAA
jgi:hypothetical protein